MTESYKLKTETSLNEFELNKTMSEPYTYSSKQNFLIFVAV